MSRLYAYPKSCAFGRVVSKAKLFAAAKATASLRERYTEQISQIRWAYKLFPEGLNLAGSKAVPEIQIFTLALKTPDLDQSVLTHIDKAVAYPVIFELSFERHLKTIAAYKRPPETGHAHWVTSDYYETDWTESDAIRTSLPVALNLAGLYTQIISGLMPYPSREGESIQDQADRISEIKTQERTCERLKSKVSKEKQFNRRVAFNQDLKVAEARLSELTE